MQRTNFTFNQKCQILSQQLPRLQCVNQQLGIFLCPACSQPMSLGRDKGQIGSNNYLSIHHKFGFQSFNPRSYPQVSEIHIDHINPCANSGSNNLSNAQIICSKCNLDLSSISSSSKGIITNPDSMEPDETYWQSPKEKTAYEKIKKRLSENT